MAFRSRPLPRRSRSTSWRWASAWWGCPAIVKTAVFGYDGKGQHRINAIEEAERVWGLIGHQEAIIERVVDFSHEISVVAARGLDGEFAHYGAIENHHRNHILDLSVSPARVPDGLATEAVHFTHRVLEDLGYVGVLCVEFFVTKRRARCSSTRSRRGRTTPDT